MKKRINDKTILTRVEASSKYSEYHIIMIITEENYQFTAHGKGYVVGIADTAIELSELILKEFKEIDLSLLQGSKSRGRDMMGGFTIAES